MIKKIVFWFFMCASLIAGMYALYTFEMWAKPFSLILFGAFYGFLRLKITGKW